MNKVSSAESQSWRRQKKYNKRGLFPRGYYCGVEVIGNKLPHPFYLFNDPDRGAIVSFCDICRSFPVTYEMHLPKEQAGKENVTVYYYKNLFK